MPCAASSKEISIYRASLNQGDIVSAWLAWLLIVEVWPWPWRAFMRHQAFAGSKRNAMYHVLGWLLKCRYQAIIALS